MPTSNQSNVTSFLWGNKVFYPMDRRNTYYEFLIPQSLSKLLKFRISEYMMLSVCYSGDKFMLSRDLHKMKQSQK